MKASKIYHGDNQHAQVLFHITLDLSTIMKVSWRCSWDTEIQISIGNWNDSRSPSAKYQAVIPHVLYA